MKSKKLLFRFLALLICVLMVFTGCAGTSPVTSDDDDDDSGSSSSSGSYSSNGLTKAVPVGSTGIVVDVPDIKLSDANSFDYSKLAMELDINVAFGDKLSTLEGASSLAMLKEYNINSLGGKISVNAYDSVYKASVDTRINGTNFIGASAIADVPGDAIYVTVPELSRKSLALEGAQLEEVMLALQVLADYYNESIPEFVEKFENVDYASILSKYFEIVADNAGDYTSSSASVSAGGVSENVTALTYSVSSNDIVTILEAVHAAAKDDQDVYDLFDAYYELMMSMSEEMLSDEDAMYAGLMMPEFDAMYGQIMDSFKTTIDEMKNYSDDEEVINIVLYKGSDNRLRGLVIDNEVEIYIARNGNKSGFELIADGETLVSGGGEYRGNKFTGSFSFTADGNSVTFDIRDFLITADSAEGVIALNLGQINSDVNYDLEIDFESRDNRSKFGILLAEGGEMLVDADLSMVVDDNSQRISIPNNCVNMLDDAAVEAWVTEISENMSAVTSALSRCNVSNALIADIMSSM